MANSSLSQSDIDTLVAKLNTTTYLASIGTSSYGPLANAPTIEPNVQLKDLTLYETGTKVVARKIVQNNLILTLRTRDVDAALTLIAGLKEGDNPLASANAKSITLAPITDTATEKGFTFGNAYLMPDRCRTNLGENDEPTSVDLVFDCHPMVVSNSNTGVPFTYAVLS